MHSVLARSLLMTAILPLATALPAPAADADPVPPAVEPGSIAVDPSAAAAKETRFHGYLRAGAGVNGEGGAMERFLDSRVGRLGNESDLYGEVAISHDLARTATDRWFVTLRAALSDAQWSDGNSVDINLPEAFVGAEGLLGQGEALWVGRRFYRRRDVHVMDFYYANLSGNGAGIEHLATPLGAFSAAVIINGREGQVTVVDGATPVTVDASSGDHGRPVLSALCIGLDTAWLDTDLVLGGSRAGTYQDAGGIDYAYQSVAMGGLALYLHHELPGGRNLLALQGGLGAADPFNLDGFPDTALTPVIGTSTERTGTAHLVRLVEDIAWRPGDAPWQVAAAADAEWADDGVGDDGIGRRIDLVARPSWWFTPNLGIAAEPGASWIDQPGRPTRLVKATVALQARVTRDLFARPVLRVFATWAWWEGGEANASGAYAGDDRGLNIGAQTEVWW